MDVLVIGATGFIGKKLCIRLEEEGFSVDKIFLVHNDEINLKWKLIGSFPLKK